MDDNEKKELGIYAAVLTAGVAGTYAGFCWLTDTWGDAPPSVHVMAMVIGACMACALAIFIVIH